MITPIDIKKQTFERTLRGYNIEEVQAFLSMISIEWELLAARLRASEQELKAVKDQLDLQLVTQQQHLDQIEQIKNQARLHSNSVVQEGGLKREHLLKDISVLEQTKANLFQEIHHILHTVSEVLLSYGVETTDALPERNRSKPSDQTKIDNIIDAMD